jgi:hypothetical protein
MCFGRLFFTPSGNFTMISQGIPTHLSLLALKVLPTRHDLLIGLESTKTFG